MLVCPQCQYDNPNHSHSCLRCGTSLSHKACAECQTMVSFEDEKCPNCGAFTATVWWTVIAGREDVPDPNVAPESLDPLKLSVFTSQTPGPLSNGTVLGNSLPESAIKIIESQYLDPGQRYRLIGDKNSFPTGHDNHHLNEAESIDKRLPFQGRVVDCQPLQKSVLKVLLAQQEEGADNHNTTDSSDETKIILWHQIGIPKLAFPYLNLLEFRPLIPDIHDGWTDGTSEVILLSDRSKWQLLSELWATSELPTLQIVYWLNEMASLWTPLEEVHCCQSLLIKENLRVDEDQTFGLLKLYSDKSDRSYTLQDLGRMWQELLNDSQQQKEEALEQLISQLISGEIDSISQLRLELEKLAEQEQPHSLADEDFEGVTESFEDEDLATLSWGIDFDAEDDQLDTGTEDETIIEGSLTGDFSTADLPMQLLSITDAGCTDIGRLRRHNEDHFGLETQIKKQHSNRGQKVQARGLYIVCDGMGGHASGEVASAMAVDTLQRYFASHWRQGLPDAKTIEEGILLANDTIYQVNQDKDSYGCGRMGTTLVMVLVDGIKIAIAHVGDSRIYQVNRKWGLEQLTVDHEVGQRAIAEGVDPTTAYSRPDAYQLTQALGPHDNQFIKPDIKYLELHEDTLLLLCSDGLSDNKFVETHYSSCLTPLISSSANLDEGLRKFIVLANQKNGHDNITAILVRLKLQPYFEQPF